MAALGLIQRGEVVEHGGHIEVVGAQRLFADCQQALSKRHRLSVLAFTIELGDLGVKRVGVVAMLRPGRLSENERPQHDKCGCEPREAHHARPFSAVG